MWADDFWGSYAWEWWEAQLRKVLPAAEFPIVDLPPDHPLFRAQFIVKETPQIAVDRLLVPAAAAARPSAGPTAPSHARARSWTRTAGSWS